METDVQGSALLTRKGPAMLTETVKREADEIPTLDELKGAIPPQCFENSLRGARLCSLPCAACDLTVLLTGFVLYSRFLAKEHLRACRRPASTSAERSLALRAACAVHQPADRVDAWTGIFGLEFLPFEDEMQFAKVSRVHAGIARAAHERRGLQGWVWWRSDPTVRSFLTSLLQGSLPGRQRVVAPVYAYEVKSEYSSYSRASRRVLQRLVLKFAGLPLVPVVEHATHHIGFYLKDLTGMTSFDAEVHVKNDGPVRGWRYLTTPSASVYGGHGARITVGTVDSSLLRNEDFHLALFGL